MSFSEQQWTPTSVQVTVLQARGLRIKGKSGTNDAYALMQVGKEKYQTSVVEKTVAPVWKEEATFDLPPLQGGGRGGPERGTLHVHVLHRALVGPDKLLGQAVINLPQLSEDRSRNKTEWFKLFDKTGKPDKDRGEVLVDIQFMRNNMTASMFDLSAVGKSRSRLGKLKDKVRGKKKESDSVSSVVPSFSQVLTDSGEEEANGDGMGACEDGNSKKHKKKSLFSPKTNLQRNLSQSMSVLPPKNSFLSGSQSSGLNVEPSEGKKKFKFMIHKRSSSSESKDSSAGHHKQVPVEQSTLCINGSHVYCEEPQPRTSRISSNFSVVSSGHGSMEEVPESSPPSVDSLRAGRQCSPWTEEEEEEKNAVDGTKREQEERTSVEEHWTKEEEALKSQEVLERLPQGKLRREEEERMELEEKVKREEEERIWKEEKRKTEERLKKEEEEQPRLSKERERQEEELKRKLEEKKQREEIIRRNEEKMRQEEEERAEEMRRQERENKLAGEKRALEEEERRAKEKIRQEEEQMRVAEEKAEEERRRKEAEEEQVREQEMKQSKQREEEGIKEKEECERIKEEVKLQEERKRIEVEENLKKLEAEKIKMEEEERKRQQMEEKRRLEYQERKRIEQEKNQEEERIRKEEEMRQVKEKERRQQEELERLRKEEEERRVEEERIRKEEEIRKVKEERERRKQEELERVRKEEEERRKVEEERIRKEEEMRKVKEEKEKRQQEELERLRKEEEERRRVEEEERIRKEMRQKEEMLRRQEEVERLAREKLIQEEEERRKIQEKMVEEDRIRKEEAMTHERARKEREEFEKLEEEKIRQEKRRKDEEERMKEQEIIRKKEIKRRQEDQETASEEKYTTGRISMGTKSPEEKRIEGEDEVRGEKRAENEKGKEGRKQGKEFLREAEEQMEKESNMERGAGNKCIPSTNPFDENPFESPEDESDCPSVPHSHTAEEEPVQQRSQLSVSLAGTRATSTNEKDPVTTHREKRPAPLPPGKNPAERPRLKEQDLSAERLPQVNQKAKDVKTVSVPPQRSVRTLQNTSTPEPKNTQRPGQNGTTKVTTTKHGKRPAPSRPSALQEPSSEPKTASGKPQGAGSEKKQVQIPHSLNPFEDDDNDDEDETSAAEDTGPVQWPAAMYADKDDSKIKSSKLAHAPLPPPNDNTVRALVSQTNDKGRIVGTSVTNVPKNDPQVCVREEGPPPSLRRLQPVKPLNAPEQQSALVMKGEKDHKSADILSGLQDKTKVNNNGITGPYSQLTREELISLVLKQENQLSERDKKISELEQYIDNLLVRVIEDQPSILMSLNSLKKAA